MKDVDKIDLGDFVKVAVGGERLWFRVLHTFGNGPRLLGVVAELDSEPVNLWTTFDGKVTLDRDWIIEVAGAPPKPTLHLVK